MSRFFLKKEISLRRKVEYDEKQQKNLYLVPRVWLSRFGLPPPLSLSLFLSLSIFMYRVECISSAFRRCVLLLTALLSSYSSRVPCVIAGDPCMMDTYARISLSLRSSFLRWGWD